ncbi:hypothetical protein [Azospirillum sp. SYSU D00513]|uniref:hypothetical protein n=1 Tax=Azospirillum sp. SYSU D00513 TaxID=2812561 RepID=UPI001A97BFFA|nr:hypothetical protein [Azospirillum sp. SYSU D00513]
MLKTFFIWGFVVFPLAVALIWSLYRARFFVLGVAGIALVISMIWGVLRLTDRFDRPAEVRDEIRATPIACFPAPGTHVGRVFCGS